MLKQFTSKVWVICRKPGFLISGFLLPGLALVAVILFSGFHFTWARTVVLITYLLFLFIGSFRTEVRERNNHQKDELSCSVSVPGESCAMSLEAVIAEDTREIAKVRTRVLTSLEPGRRTQNQALSAIGFRSAPETRSSEDVLREVGEWEHDCDVQLSSRLLNAIIRSDRAELMLKVQNNSENPAGDITVELKFPSNCLIWECGHSSHLTDSLPIPPEGLHQRNPLGISPKSIHQISSLGITNTHQCASVHHKNSDLNTVTQTIKSLLAYESRMIGPIYVGVVDGSPIVELKWNAKSALRSGVRAGQLTVRVLKF